MGNLEQGQVDQWKTRILRNTFIPLNIYGIMANTLKKDFMISSYDLNPRGKARLTTIANFFQEMAYAHANQLGFGYEDMKQKQTMWVLSRMKIRIIQYPSWDDTIRLETWHRGMNRIFGLRDFRVEDSNGNLTGMASTYWLVLDIHTKRPIRPKDDVLNKHANYEAVFENDLDKILLPDGMELLDQRKVVYSDLDIMGHVNNVKYMEWCIDAATLNSSEIPEIRELEINFLHEARYGDIIEIFSIEASDIESLFLARRIGDDQEIFRTRLVWDKTGH